MKILIISRYHPSNLAKGGPELITKNLYDALKKKGYEVDLLSPKQFGSRNKFLIFFKFVGVIFADRKKYDIINVESGSDILPLLVLPFRRAISCPIVLTAHGFPKLTRPYPFGDRHERMMGLMYSANKNIICVSNLLKNAIVSEFNISKKNTHNFQIIHNGVNEIYFKASSTAKVRYDNGYNLLLIGGINELKGIWFLINVLKQLKNMDWHLTIIGKSSPSSDIIDGYGWESRITYIEWLEPRELIYHYDNCDIVVAPSRFDTFNVPVLEGMARGKPVITTYSSGASEIIDNYRDGIIVNFGDINSLRNAMIFLANREKRVQIGCNARKKAEKYSWIEVSKQYINSYQRFIDKTQ